MERSFVEVWSLPFDDIGLIEGVNRSGRVWFAFQLSFFRERARFPSRSGDVRADVLQYLAEQLGTSAPEAGDFEFGHVTARRHRAAILRHLGIRRATDRDRQALREELAAVFRGSFGRIEDQIELGYLESRARGYFVCAVGQDHGTVGSHGSHANGAGNLPESMAKAASISKNQMFSDSEYKALLISFRMEANIMCLTNLVETESVEAELRHKNISWCHWKILVTLFFRYPYIYVAAGSVD